MDAKSFLEPIMTCFTKYFHEKNFDEIQIKNNLH